MAPLSLLGPFAFGISGLLGLRVRGLRVSGFALLGLYSFGGYGSRNLPLRGSGF